MVPELRTFSHVFSVGGLPEGLKRGSVLPHLPDGGCLAAPSMASGPGDDTGAVLAGLWERLAASCYWLAGWICWLSSVAFRLVWRLLVAGSIGLFG